MWVMGRILLVVVACVFAGAYWFGVYAIAARFVLHGPVTEASLTRSVYDAAPFGLLSLPECDFDTEPTSCLVHDDSGGGVFYDVKVRPDSSCWDATLALNASSEVSEPPPTLSGCVRRWQWSIL